MINLILIMGPSGSGKSYLQQLVVKEGYTEIISSTTRDIREGEVNGLHYHFKKDSDDFFKDEYIEHAQVGGNYYGTPVKEFYKASNIVHVVEPYGAKQIVDRFKEDDNISIKLIFLDIDKDICKVNLLKGADSLSEKDQLRLDRDIKDDIGERVKETKLNIHITFKSLDYDIVSMMESLNK